MISLTTPWYVWALLVANIFMHGMVVGQWDTNRLIRRRVGKSGPNGGADGR